MHFSTLNNTIKTVKCLFGRNSINNFVFVDTSNRFYFKQTTRHSIYMYLCVIIKQPYLLARQTTLFQSQDCSLTASNDTENRSVSAHPANHNQIAANLMYNTTSDFLCTIVSILPTRGIEHLICLIWWLEIRCEKLVQMHNAGIENIKCHTREWETKR